MRGFVHHLEVHGAYQPSITVLVSHLPALECPKRVISTVISPARIGE